MRQNPYFTAYKGKNKRISVFLCFFVRMVVCVAWNCLFHEYFLSMHDIDAMKRVRVLDATALKIISC